MDHVADEPQVGLQITTVRGDADADTELVSVHVALSGELDLASTAHLDQHLTQILASGDAVELDLSGLTFIDSTGLGLLVRRSLSARDGNKLKILHTELSDQVRRLIELTNTAQVLWP